MTPKNRSSDAPTPALTPAGVPKEQALWGGAKPVARFIIILFVLLLGECPKLS